MPRRKQKLTPAEQRAANERRTSIVTPRAMEAADGEWLAGAFEVRVFASKSVETFPPVRVVLRGRVSGHTVESRGIITIWQILRCLTRLHYLNADAGPHPYAPPEWQAATAAHADVDGP